MRWPPGALLCPVLLLLAIAPATLPSPAFSQSTAKDAKDSGKPKPAGIDRNGILILVRTAIAALDQANKTGNYTVLRDIGAPGFQSNSAARLGEIFAAHRAQKLDLGGALVLEPQLTLMPQIEANGMLHIAGFFPSVPMEVDFELLFAPHERQWKLFGISVNVSDSGPVAPETAPVPRPAPPQEEPRAPSAEVNPDRFQGKPKG